MIKKEDNINNPDNVDEVITYLKKAGDNEAKREQELVQKQQEIAKKEAETVVKVPKKSKKGTKNTAVMVDTKAVTKKNRADHLKPFQFKKGNKANPFGRPSKKASQINIRNLLLNTVYDNSHIARKAAENLLQRSTESTDDFMVVHDIVDKPLVRRTETMNANLNHNSTDEQTNHRIVEIMESMPLRDE